MFQNHQYKRLVETIVTKKVNKIFKLDEGAKGHFKRQALDTNKIEKTLQGTQYQHQSINKKPHRI